MDGTLVDSSEYHKRAWKNALAGVGYDLSDDDFARTFGLRNDAILRLLLGTDTTDDTIRQVETGKEQDYRRQVRDQGLELLPGVRSWLDRLAGDGWRQAIGTSAPSANLELILDVTDTRRYFEVLITATDVKKGKPDPEVYFTAASRLAVPIDRCVVVEDAPSAVEGALKAGLHTIDVGNRRMTDLPVDIFEKLVPA